VVDCKDAVNDDWLRTSRTSSRDGKVRLQLAVGRKVRLDSSPKSDCSPSSGGKFAMSFSQNTRMQQVFLQLIPALDDYLKIEEGELGGDDSDEVTHWIPLQSIIW